MKEKIKAVMFGHAVADALGVPVEFCSRQELKNAPITDMTGYGTYNMPPGCWSDDTSMALCELESLKQNRLDFDDIMQNFVKWVNFQEFTPTGVLFDIGNTTKNAIINYQDAHLPAEKCGETSAYSNGNGSLMRVHPFVLYAVAKNMPEDDFDRMIETASLLTHAHRCSVDGCLIYAHVLKCLLLNPCRQAVLIGIGKVKRKVQTKKLYDRILSCGIFSCEEKDIKSTGYVVDSLEAALWCLLTTQTYRDCVLKAVNLGEDTDTVAAISGSLAGALYGLDAIPRAWMQALKKSDYIENMCSHAAAAWC